MECYTLSTVKYENPEDMFRQVISFANYVFDTSGYADKKEGIYILFDWKSESDGVVPDEVYKFGLFNVVVIKTEQT